MKDVSLIVYPAADLAKAKQFFRELIGTDPYADSPCTSATRAATWKSGWFRTG